MTLSMAEIQSVVADLKARLEGGHLERIDQPDRHRLVLRIRSGSARYWLLISVHPRFSRLHLLTARPEEGRPAAGFCNVLRQHLTGAPVVSISQAPGDRVVFIESAERDRLMQPHKVTLVAELVGVASNLVLLDEDGRILEALDRERSPRRTLGPGEPYVPLTPPEVLPDAARGNRFAGTAEPSDPLALSRAVQAHYARLEAEDALETARANLLGQVEAELRRRRTRLQNVERELKRSEQAESIRRQGELLKIALPQVRRGQREVEVQDFFDSAAPMVTIELDPRVTPEENLQRIFERYKKAKAGREKLAARLKQTERDVAALGQLLTRAETAGTLDALAELREQARKGRLLAPPPAARPAGKAAGPRSFVSADGLEILVARSGRQNAVLTFSIARGNDWWLHVLGWPGPHVVVRRSRDAEAPQETLIDAAHLAVHFSKLRGADYAEVVYTQRKNISRLKSAPEGTVSYSGARTMRVRMEPERIARLLSEQRTEGEGD
jgi:predicted ribosome quality control (RQC) complex YloA/Tae2 family protein